jgi:cell division protein FtsX
VMLSLPLTYGAGKVVGAHGLYVTLPFIFRPDALALWLGIAAAVTALTVWLATRDSLRVPVRAVLAYE